MLDDIAALYLTKRPSCRDGVCRYGVDSGSGAVYSTYDGAAGTIEAALALAVADSASDEIGHCATKVAQETNTGVVGGALPIVAELLRRIKARVAYVKDPARTELVRSPRATLALGYGDCEDLSALLASAAYALGYTVRLVAIGYDAARPERYHHVIAQVLDPASGEWIDADPSERGADVVGVGAVSDFAQSIYVEAEPATYTILPYPLPANHGQPTHDVDGPGCGCGSGSGDAGGDAGLAGPFDFLGGLFSGGPVFGSAPGGLQFGGGIPTFGGSTPGAPFSAFDRFGRGGLFQNANPFGDGLFSDQTGGSSGDGGAIPNWLGTVDQIVGWVERLGLVDLLFGRDRDYYQGQGVVFGQDAPPAGGDYRQVVDPVTGEVAWVPTNEGGGMGTVLMGVAAFGIGYLFLRKKKK